MSDWFMERSESGERFAWNSAWTYRTHADGRVTYTPPPCLEAFADPWLEAEKISPATTSSTH